MLYLAIPLYSKKESAYNQALTSLQYHLVVVALGPVLVEPVLVGLVLVLTEGVLEGVVLEGPVMGLVLGLEPVMGLVLGLVLVVLEW